jgi:hypothetical protein
VANWLSYFVCRCEAFLDQDLSDPDFSQFEPVQFEFLAKAARLNMRLPVPPLDAVKARAKAQRSLHPLYPRGSRAGDKVRAAALKSSKSGTAASERRRSEGL